MTYAAATIFTWFSLLHSAIAPELLLEVAARYHVPAVGIVDQATTLAHARLAQAARATPVHVAYGTTLRMEDGFVLRALARDEDGYRNLCRLISAQAAGSALRYAAVRTQRDGLYLLCGGRQGYLWHLVRQGDARAVWALARLQALADRSDHFLVECQQYRTDTSDDVGALEALLNLAEQGSVRAIATHDVRVLDPHAGRTLRLLGAIGARTTFWADDPALPAWQKGHPSPFTLPHPADWHRQWNGLEHLVEGSAAVLRECQVDLLAQRRFPGATMPPNDVFDALWKRAFAGLQRRYAQVTPPLIERLTHEINAVVAQGVGPFLITAADLVQQAAERKLKMILQGSGTGSLLCFALGISPVDPLTAEALVFERFAGGHRGAGDLPDLDFGVPAGREHEVRDLLRAMFRDGQVANLAAVSTFGGRSAIRAAALAFGWEEGEIDLLQRRLRAGDALNRQDQMVVNAAHALDGQPAHVLRHASGVIVTDAPSSEVHGVAAHADGPLLLMDKDDAEALQVLKFDLLPWYVLAIYDQAERTIQAAQYPPPNLWQVPGTDEATGILLAHADTRAIPFLQSPACMTLLRALKVRTEADIALALGALRPGASTTRERLLAAMHGGSATLAGWQALTPAHQDAISAILVPSRGALIFDEDLLRVANLLGLNFADAERLRKALKNGNGDTQPQLNALRAAALRRGWSDTEIDVVASWLVYVQRYTYTRGHAIAMAHVAWRVARIAAHYPAHLYAAVLDHLGSVGGGMYPNIVYVTEAQRHGLTVMGPNVNSAWHSVPQGTTIHAGLVTLRACISENTLRRVQQAGQDRPFHSIADLLERVVLTERDLEQLICAGALEPFTTSHRHARWEAHLARPTPQAQPPLLPEAALGVVPAIEAETAQERAHEEYATLGWTRSVAHPMAVYEAALAEQDVLPVATLGQHIGQTATVAGIIVATRHIHTQHGTPMLFVSLCDASGVAELVVFDNAVTHHHGRPITCGHVICAQGMVTHDQGRGVTLEVATVQVLR